MADVNILIYAPIDTSDLDRDMALEIQLLNRFNELVEQEPTQGDYHNPSILPVLPHGPLTEREIAIHLHAESLGFQKGHVFTHELWKYFDQDMSETTLAYFRKKEQNATRKHKAQLRVLRRKVRQLEALRSVREARFAVGTSFFLGLLVGLNSSYLFESLASKFG